jgi:Fic family protein
LPDEPVEVADDYGVVFHTPPSAEELSSRIQTLCDFANGKLPDSFVHPVVRAIMVHFALAYAHPFVDGNGRTARAVFYWCMLRYKYPLFEYISISEILLKAPHKYYRAFLYTESDDNDLSYFLMHQAGVIKAAVEMLKAYIGRKSEDLRMTADALQGTELLNHRQQALIAHALRHPDTLYAIQIHKDSHGISYQTARDDLVHLSDMKLLTLFKQGKKFLFRATDDLQNRLSSVARKFHE